MKLYHWYVCTKDLYNHTAWPDGPCFTEGELYQVTKPLDKDGHVALGNNYGADHYINPHHGWGVFFVIVNPFDKEIANRILAKQAELSVHPGGGQFIRTVLASDLASGFPGTNIFNY